MTDPSRRRSGLPALLLALLFLAILGSSAGYLVGNQVNKHRELSDSGGIQGGDQPDGGAPVSTDDGATCPAVSERDAKRAGSPGGLHRVFFMETASSRVWICEDDAGELWYQGHRKDGELDSDTHGLLLRGVEKDANGVYVAVNVDQGNRTRYIVYGQTLVVETNGVEKSKEPATSVQTG